MRGREREGQAGGSARGGSGGGLDKKDLELENCNTQG